MRRIDGVWADGLLAPTRRAALGGGGDNKQTADKGKNNCFLFLEKILQVRTRASFRHVCAPPQLICGAADDK